MKILVVAKFVPWPPDSGDKRRTLAVVTALAGVGTVTLCAFSGPDERPKELDVPTVVVRDWPRDRVRPLATARGILRTRSLSAGRFWDPALSHIVKAAGDLRPDVIVVEHIQMAAYVAGISAKMRILDMHNIESALAASRARASRRLSSLPYRVESLALRKVERSVAGTFDTVLVVTEPDRLRLSRIAPHADVVVCPNGWEPSPHPAPMNEKPAVVFVALLSWGPNVDAAVWLVKRVWPLVRRRRADARLILAGRNPSAAVRDLAGCGVEVTGTVKDLGAVYAKAMVAVAPLQAGGGSRLKILEAMDLGRPIVSTTIGAEGLEDLIGVGVAVADDPVGFADQIVALLDDPNRARAMGLQGRTAVHARHTWSAALAPLVGRLRAVGATQRPE
jgi:glycosyltransferase involved in cell wall biosynthesis